MFVHRYDQIVKGAGGTNGCMIVKVYIVKQLELEIIQLVGAIAVTGLVHGLFLDVVENSAVTCFGHGPFERQVEMGISVFAN